MRPAEKFADSHLIIVLPDHECGFRKRGGLRGGRPVRRTVPFYTATATLWKVEETASNV